jgi:hypothetical protein
MSTRTFGTMIFLEEKELYFIYAEGLEAIIMRKLLSEKIIYNSCTANLQSEIMVKARVNKKMNK